MMEIKDGLYRLEIRFKVAESIERFVYMYLILGKKIHVVDTGVAGTEACLSDYLAGLGRGAREVGSILLTHAHPDHIGGAAAIKELSGCSIYAGEEERRWIENIEVQFDERPIPNFHGLVNRSAQVDETIKDGDVLVLEDGVTVEVLETKGHSRGSLSFRWVEKRALFTGDAVPVVGEIPIFMSAVDSARSLRKLLAVRDVDCWLSAWDDVFEGENGIANIGRSLEHILSIDGAVKKVLRENPEMGKERAYARICETLGLAHLIDNPLFRRSIRACMSEA